MSFTPTKLKLFSLIPMLAAPLVSQAQINFTFQNAKAGFQESDDFVSYDGGFFQIGLTDGSIVVSPCAGANPGPLPTPIPANPFCPLGTNAIVVGFGASAPLTGQYSLAGTPTPASLFAVNRPDLIQVIAAPPSLLERPELLPISDQSLSASFSYLTPPFRQFNIAFYTHNQIFGATESERERHDDTIPHGEGPYIFGYPRVQTTAQIEAGLEPAIQPVPVNTAQMPESFPGITGSPLDQGFRFLNGTGDTDGRWRDGMIELDPSFEMNMEWEGLISGTNINFATDNVSMWVESERSANPLGGVSANVLYPALGFPVALDLEPINASLGIETLPPFYFGWAPGDEVVLYLRMDRNLFSTGNAVVDTSFRVWALPIRFITTFRSFALAAFPQDTPNALRAPDVDFDSDGFSNFLEFAANTDPADAASAPDANFPGLVTTLTDDGRISASVAKRPNVGGALIYDLEWSPDMDGTWIPIPREGDDIWEVVETDTELTATARVAGVPATAFVRARLTLVE